MLLELTIKNIALIESLRIEFAQGFNVLTGETGAGKSIVVDSVNLALGGRADREIIRTGAVSVDHMPEERTDRVLEAGALLSIRGFGRIRVREVGSPTRKDRLPVQLEIFHKS
jgi:DNA repair ATPase RecN